MSVQVDPAILEQSAPSVHVCVCVCVCVCCTISEGTKGAEMIIWGTTMSVVSKSAQRPRRARTSELRAVRPPRTIILVDYI